MIEVLPAPDVVAAFHLRGTLSEQDYERCIAEIEGRLARHPRIGIYCDLMGLDTITLAAMRKDLRYLGSKFGQLHRFARGAVITGRPWLAGLTRYAGLLFPQTELRSFDPADRQAAMHWVADVGIAGPGRHHSRR